MHSACLPVRINQLSHLLVQLLQYVFIEMVLTHERLETVHTPTLWWM